MLRDAVADFGRRIEDAAVVADLGEAAKAADDGGGGESLEVSVVDLGSESGGPDLIEADVLVITLKEGSRARIYVGRDILVPSYAEHRMDPTL